MPEIITRAEARARGLKRYFTGKPCKRGHLTERFCMNAKDIASKVVVEVKDSARLFFTPVRVIVSEFSKAVQQSSRFSRVGVTAKRQMRS